MARTTRLKTAEFRIHAPTARKVSIAGTFNNWDIRSDQAKKDTKGNWTAKVSLKPGRHEYKFVIDGSWISDPNCTNFTSNAFGTQNCVLEVK
jgi:1,4-alpha-glucan branching enzyme